MKESQYIAVSNIARLQMMIVLVNGSHSGLSDEQKKRMATVYQACETTIKELRETIGKLEE
jgi:hypothetical protein